MKGIFHMPGKLAINNSHHFFLICCVAPFIGGFISIWLGADTNWDLRNYHLYNPFAFLNQKIAIDLAPAGLQTYFNPLLDIPYYWMVNHLPAIIVGFVMGFVHAGNFVLIALIARQLLPTLVQTDKFKLPLLLALFGCLTANFSAAFGNTMGDIVTALFILSSLLIILNGINSTLYLRTVPLLVAGFLAGTATGLKLTNAIFAVALCASLLFLPASWPLRIKYVILFGVAAFAGLMLTGGYWFLEMWLQFGNPVFPQFSAFFHNDLTRNIAIADTHWYPKNLYEALLWPIIFSVDALRVGELKHHQFLWAIFYIVVIIWVIRLLLDKIKNSSTISLTSASKYTIAFVFVAFVVWMKLFSIQRYLVAIEVLVPLMIFILLAQICTYERARKYTKRALILSTAIIYLGGAKTWGHADWAWDMFRVELPAITSPEKTTVIIASGDMPLGWVAAQFPAEIAFAQVEGSFPANVSVYSQHIHHTVSSRGGEVFVMFPTEVHSAYHGRVADANKFLSFSGLTQSAKSCDFLGKLIPMVHIEKKVRLDYEGKNNCYLTSLAQVNPTHQTDAFYQAQATQQLNAHGFEINLSSCKLYNAYLGKNTYPFKWCSIHRQN